jgi:drug/metabolite transporter (DMT)-like permease
MTPIFEAVAVRRRLSGQLQAAMLLGLVGIALLVGGDGFSAPSGGDLLMLGAAVTRALLGVAESRFTRAGAAGGTDVLQLTTIELTLGAAFFAVWGGRAALAHVPEFTGPDWANLVYLTVGCTLLAFVGQLWATKHTSASRASILLGTEPGWALIVGIVLAGEAIGAASMAGALILLVAVTWGGRAEYRWRTTKPHRRSDGHGRPPLAETR